MLDVPSEVVDANRKKGKWARCLFPLLFLLAACSDQALNLFFDIPLPTPQEQAAAEAKKAAAEKAKAAETARAAGTQPAAAVKEEDEPPPIEKVTTWEKAAEMLPKDDNDAVDWMAALRQGVIKPRYAIGGARSRERDGFRFAFDFYLPGPDPSMDALFPHSSHTQWLACASCHPKIFRVRGTELSMDDIFEGNYCGTCHGSVAFSLENCTRCHTAME